MDSSLPPGLSLDMIPSMAPPPGIEPNFANPVTLATPINAVCATTSVIAFVLLSIRLYSTLRITRSASYDDAASAAASVFALAYAGLIINTRGNARHGWDLPISAYTATYFELILFETIVAAFGFLFSKLSILLLLFRLFFPTQRFRYFVYVGMLWATVISLASAIVAGALCAPRHGESFSSMIVVKRCSHEDMWAVVQGALNMSLDFYILYLPIPMVWKLQMGQRRKLGVMAIFMTGLVACVASTANLAYKVKLLDSADTLWNSYIVDILNIVELNVAIMVACMPACASFSRHFFKKYEIISSIRSRLSSTRSSSIKEKLKEKLSEPQSTTAPPSDLYQHEPSGGNKYWKIRNPFSDSNGRNDAPPQITMDKQHSRVLQTGDFDVFRNIEDQQPFGERKTKRASLELKDSSFDQEKRAPYDMV